MQWPRRSMRERSWRSARPAVLLVLLNAPAARCYIASRIRYFTDACETLHPTVNGWDDIHVNQATSYLASDYAAGM